MFLYQSLRCCHRAALSTNANFLSFYELCFWCIPCLSESRGQHGQLWELTYLLVPVVQCTLILTLNFGSNSVHLCSLFFQS